MGKQSCNTGAGTLAPMDHYDLLGLEREATAASIRAAYLRLCATTHPDRPGGSPEAFDALKKAYAVLSNEESRAVYDERLPAPNTARPKVRQCAQE
jgi:curved DNA-binding protein CbpA